MRHSRTAWTPHDIKSAAEMYNYLIEHNSPNAACEIIGKAIGRSPKSVKSRVYVCGPSFNGGKRAIKRPYRKRTPKIPRIANFIHKGKKYVKADPAALAERDQRRSLVPASTTALLMGDPLPGRSALDQKSVR